MNIFDFLGLSANKHPDQVAIIDEFGELTYGQLLEEAKALKSWLISQGVKQGQVLGLLAGNNRNFIIGLFAGAGSGAITLPISHQLKPAEQEKLIAEAKPHFILKEKKFAPVHLVTDEKTTEWGQWSLTFGEGPMEAPSFPTMGSPKPIAFMRFTSGTTGKAKGVLISHQAVEERTAAANQALQLGMDSRVCWVLPMAYHFIVSVVLYIRYGATMVICKDIFAKTLLQNIVDHQCDFLYASPMHIKLLVGDKSEVEVPSLQKVISTSTAISPKLCEAFENKYGIPVKQAYGIIEIGLPIINDKVPSGQPGAVGHALPAYQVAALDKDGEPLPAGEEGQLAIKGPGMFEGYSSPPTPRDKVLANGWFLTGDMAVISTDGLVSISGRAKSMINVSGNKVFPEEVEQVLDSHPAVKESKVFRGSHLLLGEMVEAKVVTKTGKMLDAEALMEFCRERLSTYKVPQKIHFTDFIPMTESGKISRK